MGTVESYRARNEASFGQLVGLTLPMAVLGAGAAAHMLGVALAGAVVSAVAVAVFIARGVPLFISPVISEFRDDDYSPLARASFVISPLLPVAASPLLQLLPEADLGWHAAATAAYWSLGASYALWVASRRAVRIGRRRIRSILAGEAPEIPERVRVSVREHRDLLAALVAVGAVDGAEVRASQLARLMSLEVEALAAPLVELDRVGALRVVRIGLQKELPRWGVSVTELGVWALRQGRGSRRRR